MTGYLHSAYADALREFGEPVLLPSSKGWILKRHIPGSGYPDAMGTYPLFCCENWSRASEDVLNLSGQLVSLVLVADPFGDYSEPELHRIFSLVRPFKQHLLVDLHAPLQISKHHRYYSRRALESVSLDQTFTPAAYGDEFAGLYQTLIARHRLTGLKAFSPASLVLQCRVPGAVMFRARQDGVTVAAHLWMVQNDIAYSHLLAMSEQGYESAASYALYGEAIEFFRGKVRWLDLGAGASFLETSKPGLQQFKEGWSNDRRTVYLCGATLHEDEYRRLSSGCAAGEDYFPAYRKNELVSREDPVAEEFRP